MCLFSLDGSTPSFTSVEYRGSFALSNSATVRAIAYTTPVITTIGSGQVQSFPIAPPFEYGSTVRLMAVPSTGNYFFRWANAVTGAVSPATLFVTNATPAVSALFSDLGSNQSSLTLLVDGSGTVSVSPVANVLTNGPSTTLTALPDLGHVFLGWTGSVAGLSNPTTIQMNGSAVVVTAHFAPGVRFLSASSILNSNGFSLSMEGVPGFAFRLQQSSNLEEWTQVELLTNQTGHFDYLHRGATNNQTLFYRVVGK